MQHKLKYMNYNDFIGKFYGNKNLGIEACRNVTFQVTDDCPMACTYCYQINKGHKIMTKETAKKCVDILFDMYENNNHEFINKNTKAIILDFIGGEPLMAVDIIDYICSYFMDKCIELDHPWAYTWKASMTTNGALYFNENVQKFLNKHKGRISFSITLDGPKEIHDACRIYHDGRGNFDDAYAALQHFNKNYYQDIGTKVTIAPENLKDLNKIINFFVEEGIKVIHANTVYEAEWTKEHGQIFYQELKKMADYLLDLNDETVVSLFDENFFCPKDEEDIQNWCGGTGCMLAFDPDGIAYPCVRYMPSSLGNDVPALIIGSADTGLFSTKEEQSIQDYLNSINRRTQSTDECFNCSIASGCAWCSAWNYQYMGSVNKRCVNICPMHKARSLANVYYWNNYYKINNIKKFFKMYLSKEEALQFISEEEYNFLNKLSKEREEIFNDL